MRLTIQSKPLSIALARVKPVASAAATLPALSCLLLKAEGNRLHISANNLDTYIETSAECSVEQAGEVAINARRFTDAISAMGQVELSLEVDEKNALTIRRGNSMVRLMGLAASEIPPPPELRDAKSLVIPQDELKRSIATVAPFWSTDETRWVITGIGMQSHDGKLLMVTTDGNMVRQISTSADFSGNLILPSAAARIIAGLCDGEASAICALSENVFQVTGGGWRVMSKLIEGNYPNWRQVIPDEMKVSATGDRESLLSCISAASVTIETIGYPTVKLELGRSSRVVTEGRDIGNSAFDLSGFETKEPFSIAFDIRRIEAVVKSFPGEQITLQFLDAMSPMKIEDAHGRAVLGALRTA